METTLTSNSRTARLAASLFFFVCVPLSLWETNYVHSKIFVPQDPVTTAANLLSNEFIFRASIVTHLAGFLIFVMMVLLFYRVFRPVDKHLSRLMLVSILAQVPVVFVFEVFNFTALMILKSEPRSTFDVAQQQEAAYFLMRMPRYGTGAGMGKLFLGLCFIPFGMLVFRSGFAPRIIGILLIIGGVGYVADCCISILLQRADYVMVRSFLMYTTVGYALALLWFLVKGVREQKVVVRQ
ncbi:MAG: DUF4386 domain-containing protein [Cyclobacteriaceae bacterium]|nr:DUF4386 domain-containing protein [Cyclobacteriaceae bacterium]